MSASHGLTCDCGETFATVAGLESHLDEHRPETLYAVIDPTVPEGESIADDCETLSGVPFLVQEFGGEAFCEECNQTGAYFLEIDPYDVALCRLHLEQQPAVAAVVESEDEIKEFELPDGSVREGEK